MLSRKQLSRLSSVTGLLVLSLVPALGQQTTTTNTNCNLYGNTASCTSTSNSTDYGAQQQRAYEQGQQMGRALGQGLAGAIQAHAFTKGVRNYCNTHPGEEWRYFSRADGHTISTGHCPSDADKAGIAAAEFTAHHKDYIKGPSNSQAMISYVRQHELDPRQEKSYERAYKDLKKSGQLELYKH
jgi:hypothetical protein